MLPLTKKKDITIMHGQPPSHLPLKSVAGALLFSALLGPVGLLYASFWGGLFMIAVEIFIMTSHLYFIAFLIWMICCIWSVGAVETHNKKICQEK